MSGDITWSEFVLCLWVHSFAGPVLDLEQIGQCSNQGDEKCIFMTKKRNAHFVDREHNWWSSSEHSLCQDSVFIRVNLNTLGYGREQQTERRMESMATTEWRGGSETRPFVVTLLDPTSLRGRSIWLLPTLKRWNFYRFPVQIKVPPGLCQLQKCQAGFCGYENREWVGAVRPPPLYPESGGFGVPQPPSTVFSRIKRRGPSRKKRGPWGEGGGWFDHTLRVGGKGMGRELFFWVPIKPLCQAGMFVPWRSIRMLCV